MVARGYYPQLSKATLYSTHEPCIMCAYPIRHYKIPRVVLGISVNVLGSYSSQFNLLTTDTIAKWPIVPEVIIGITILLLHYLKSVMVPVCSET